MLPHPTKAKPPLLSPINFGLRSLPTRLQAISQDLNFPVFSLNPWLQLLKLKPMLCQWMVCLVPEELNTFIPLVLLENVASFQTVLTHTLVALKVLSTHFADFLQLLNHQIFYHLFQHSQSSSWRMVLKPALLFPQQVLTDNQAIGTSSWTTSPTTLELPPELP